jgi:hypothetical protein
MKFNLTQIENDPTYCFDNMTETELRNFETSYYNRIARKADQEVKRRIRAEEKQAKEQLRIALREQKERQIQEERRVREENKRQTYNDKVLALYHRISHLHTFEHTPDFVSYHGRCIGNTIHDLPVVWTGYESVKSIESRKQDPKYKPCNEHFYPRQWAGGYIINHIINNRGITLAALMRIIEVFRQVHKVTPRENRILMKYQSATDFVTPKHAYDSAGIVLKQVKETGVFISALCRRSHILFQKPFYIYPII